MAQVTILCNSCKRELYYISESLIQIGNRIDTEMLTPVSCEVPQPNVGQQCLCHFCNQPFLLETHYLGCQILTKEKGLLPKGR